MVTDFRGQVWKRVRKNDVFWSEIGSRLGEPRNTHTPTMNSQEYPPPPRGVSRVLHLQYPQPSV